MPRLPAMAVKRGLTSAGKQPWRCCGRGHPNIGALYAETRHLSRRVDNKTWHNGVRQCREASDTSSAGSASLHRSAQPPHDGGTWSPTEVGPQQRPPAERIAGMHQVWTRERSDLRRDKWAIWPSHPDGPLITRPVGLCCPRGHRPFVRRILVARLTEVCRPD